MEDTKCLKETRLRKKRKMAASFDEIDIDDDSGSDAYVPPKDSDDDTDDEFECKEQSKKKRKRKNQKVNNNDAQEKVKTNKKPRKNKRDRRTAVRRKHKETISDSSQEREDNMITKAGSSGLLHKKKTGPPHSVTGYWYIATGYIKDMTTLLESFDKLESWRFSAFATCWQELKFSLIYRGRYSFKELLEFSEEVATLSKKFLSPLHKEKWRVAALYTLYGLYYKHPYRHLFKIRLEAEEYKHLTNLARSFRTTAENPDPAYIFHKLEAEGAFHHVASSDEMGWSFYSWERQWDTVRYEMMYQNSLHAVLSESDCNIQKVLMQEYEKVKLQTFGGGAEQIQAMSYVQSNLLSDVDAVLAGLKEANHANISKESMSGDIGTSSQMSDIGKRRAEIRDRAAATSTTDQYLERRYHSPKKRKNCKAVTENEHSGNLNCDNNVESCLNYTDGIENELHNFDAENKFMKFDKVMEFMSPPSEETLDIPLRPSTRRRASRNNLPPNEAANLETNISENNMESRETSPETSLEQREIASENVTNLYMDSVPNGHGNEVVESISQPSWTGRSQKCGQPRNVAQNKGMKKAEEGGHLKNSQAHCSAEKQELQPHKNVLDGDLYTHTNQPATSSHVCQLQRSLDSCSDVDNRIKITPSMQEECNSETHLHKIHKLEASVGLPPTKSLATGPKTVGLPQTRNLATEPKTNSDPDFIPLYVQFCVDSIKIQDRKVVVKKKDWELIQKSENKIEDLKKKLTMTLLPPKYKDSNVHVVFSTHAFASDLESSDETQTKTHSLQIPSLPPKPDVSKKTDIPKKTGASPKPDLPQKPTAPKKPCISPKSGIPKQPHTSPKPSIPKTPSSPQKPVISKKPSSPQKPDMPKKPGLPLKPSKSPKTGVPKKPGRYKKPDMPSKLSIPSKPGIPTSDMPANLNLPLRSKVGPTLEVLPQPPSPHVEKALSRKSIQTGKVFMVPVKIKGTVHYFPQLKSVEQVVGDKKTHATPAEQVVGYKKTHATPVADQNDAIEKNLEIHSSQSQQDEQQEKKVLHNQKLLPTNHETTKVKLELDEDSLLPHGTICSSQNAPTVINSELGCAVSMLDVTSAREIPTTKSKMQRNTTRIMKKCKSEARLCKLDSNKKVLGTQMEAFTMSSPQETCNAARAQTNAISIGNTVLTSGEPSEVYQGSLSSSENCFDFVHAAAQRREPESEIVNQPIDSSIKQVGMPLSCQDRTLITPKCEERIEPSLDFHSLERNYEHNCSSPSEQSHTPVTFSQKFSHVITEQEKLNVNGEKVVSSGMPGGTPGDMAVARTKAVTNKPSAKNAMDGMHMKADVIEEKSNDNHLSQPPSLPPTSTFSEGRKKRETASETNSASNVKKSRVCTFYLFPKK